MRGLVLILVRKREKLPAELDNEFKPVKTADLNPDSKLYRGRHVKTPISMNVLCAIRGESP
jgi:hypothetical protein